MRARSLVFDRFGDYLRYRSGRVRLRALAAMLGCFGIQEATARVVAARLRREGRLTAEREGRETVYSLTRESWQMLDEGRARVFHRVSAPWDGQWHMVIYQVPRPSGHCGSSSAGGCVAGLLAAVLVGLGEPARPRPPGQGGLRRVPGRTAPHLPLQVGGERRRPGIAARAGTWPRSTATTATCWGATSPRWPASGPAPLTTGRPWSSGCA